MRSLGGAASVAPLAFWPGGVLWLWVGLAALPSSPLSGRAGAFGLRPFSFVELANDVCDDRAMKVGPFMRQARERAGLTQTQLADRCGTAQSAVSRIEQDKISPTIDTLERLVSATGARLEIRAVPRETPPEQ